MAVPKGFRTNINIFPSKIGPERRQEILDGISDKGTFLPRGISEEDMDESFIEFVNKDLSITIDGKKIPVIFLTIQRWSEFTKTWQFTDKYKNIELPFITVVKKPDTQVGTNQAGLYNIPGNRTYTYMKIPTWDGVRNGYDMYKIPQPTSVDLSFEVRIFTNKMRDLNKFKSIILRTFQSRQYYVNVNGHPIPVLLETINDESNIDDFENRRFYIQLFEMNMLGYLLNEEDFEVIPAINRVYTFFEVDEAVTFKPIMTPQVVNGNTVSFSFIFKPRTDSNFTFTAKYGVNFTNITNIENISNITIAINGSNVFSGLILTKPIIINANDQVGITVVKDNLAICKFNLIGNTL